MEENIDINYSEEMQDVISYVPNWMIRWGISLIFSIILLLLLISWLIKYPDVIAGRIILTTEQQPVKLVSKNSGYVEHLYFQDKQKIQKGDMIAEITNPANWQSIKKLDEFIKLIPKDEYQNVDFKYTLKQLGDIQPDFNALQKSIKEYQEFLKAQYELENIARLDQQIYNNNRLATITRNQIKLLQLEINNAREKFTGDSTLYQEGVISKYNFFENQSEWIAKRRSLENLKKSLIENEIATGNYQKERSNLRQTYEQKERDFINDIGSRIKIIQNYIKNWVKNYTIVSPTNGQISFLKTVNEKQFIKEQDELFAIISNNQDYIGLVKIPSQGFGKVEVHQKVRIKLDNFPYQEYGQVEGIVTDISLIPNEDNYLVQVALPSGLTSSYHKQLDYKPEMSGSAEIITDDLRLIERIFNQFRKAVDQ